MEKDNRDKNNRLLNLNKLVAEMNDEVKAHGNIISSLEQELQDTEKEARTKESSLEHNLATLEEHITNLRSHLDIANENNSHTAEENRALKETVTNLEKTLTDLKQHEAWSWEHIGNLEKRITEYGNELSTLYSSKSWKIGSLLGKVVNKAAPQGTIRRKVINKTYKLGASCYKALKLVKKPREVQSVQEQDPTIPKYMELPYFQKPMVSIVIPVYNQYGFTMKCIESIKNCSGNITYEVILADDKSTDATVNIKKTVKNLTVVRNRKNLRFLLNCNKAAKKVKGKYILFLNNDTVVKDNWLEPMISLMEKDKTIGMTGAKLVYPNGMLQEAGGIIWKDASGWNFGHSQNPDAPEYNYVKEVDYISGACIALPTKLWKEIGGFDKRFVPAYYEDTDLAFEVRKRGLKVVYQPLSVVVHFEGVSNGTDLSSGQKQYQVVNREKFVEKWKDVLVNHFDNACHVFYAQDRSANKKTVLFIDHYVPFYDQDAGSRVVYGYLKLLVDMGYNVKFIGDNFCNHEPYTTELQQMGIEVLYGSYYAEHWQEWSVQNKDYIDFIVLSRPHISEKYIDFFKENLSAKIIYYGVDLHCLRLMREYELTKNKESHEASDFWRKVEFNLMNKADVSITLSSYEKEYMLENGCKKEVMVTPMYCFDDLDRVKIDTSDRKNILFVGGFGHPPNEDAVLWFMKNVWKFIKGAIPECKFHIVGSKPTEKIKALASDDVIIEGYVDDNRLDEFYRNCKVAVVPLRYGAGVKGKVLEAMHKGIGLVSTRIGLEGLEDVDKYTKAYNNARKFAAAVIELYNNEDLLRTNMTNNLEFLKNHMSVEIGKEVFSKLFSK